MVDLYAEIIDNKMWDNNKYYFFSQLDIFVPGAVPMASALFHRKANDNTFISVQISSNRSWSAVACW